MIAVIDYGVGNLASVANTLKNLGMQATISSDREILQKADALILPGVGAAGEGMKNLSTRNLSNIIVNEIQRGKPFLGICLGMQLLFEKSEEGNVRCLGILKGSVVRYQKERKVPQIGWNRVSIQKSQPKADRPLDEKFKSDQLFNGIPENSYFYFVNSYYCDPFDKGIVVGTTEYGEEFASVVVYKNITATQFHPEKSGKEGAKLLGNWRTLW